MVGDKARLFITRRDHNLVLRHIDNAYIQLLYRNYYLNREEALASIADPSTVSIDLTQLRLQGNDNDKELRYFVVPTTTYDSLNPEERRLAERVHGSGDAFVQVMKMLVSARIKETIVFVLNPDYVKKNAQKYPIWQASWLNNFNGDSYVHS